ncbi:MAG: glycine cleavage system aminomethyltransferase GcvT [Thermoplasmata archaeon]|nr:glycine cleavage system aminomethyltransferase GcvT [Thermoplasmata archaeon]
MNGTPAPAPPLLRTPLYPFHLGRKAHMVPFAGWEMPLYYTGILEEHRAVREASGWFDVSHMGILTVEGEHAPELLARRTTIDATRLPELQCKYGFWLGTDGKILDDLLLTRLPTAPASPPRFLLVPNAARTDRIIELLQQHRKPDTRIARLNGGTAFIAVQGPRSRELLEESFGLTLGGMRFYTARPLGRPLAPGEEGPLGWGLVSRTGYTGELGYELLLPAAAAIPFVERLTAAGIPPCGLGARDTLRLEKGYLLSGLDFDADRSPVEAGQERFLDMVHPFVGREALRLELSSGPTQRIAGFATEAEGAIPRHGTPILSGGTLVTHATSGGLSPSLGHGIGLAYLPSALATPGTALELELRGRRVPATVNSLPFYPAARPSGGT